MFESVILGIIQGITEWLPISSEGALILVKINFFENGLSIRELINYALFLHLGTFFAALIYFRKDVYFLIKSLFRYKRTDKETKKLLFFYVLTTIISAIIGLILLMLLGQIGDKFLFTGRGITLLVGIMLLATAFMQFRKKKLGNKEIINLKIGDGILLGVVQGFSILPGLSRSGLTVSSFLLRGFNERVALKLSFLMSLPVILGGNIFLNLNGFIFNVEYLVGFIFSFLLGFLTIHLLLKLANKLNFSWFVLLFGIITILSLFV